MNVKLRDLVEIHTGYSFRNKVVHDKTGDTVVIQMKDLSDGYRSIACQPSLIDGSDCKGKHLLRKEDILFISKGTNNYAVLYRGEFQKAVATSIFFVMRPKNERIVPAYLEWYINQLPAQQYLEAGLEGTYIRNINKKTLSELPVELPVLDVQKAIAELYRLELREGMLLNMIKEKRGQLLNALLLNSIKIENHDNYKTNSRRHQQGIMERMRHF